ncbi:putative transferase At4g12130, mitochondrial isoform X2 [Cryptomeria japonica]|uniref:putative transferase At4g12130, mitochondrial isoform X2 n=1 Tax=Cryptomeria japonica TaxID=3369 RepID=UPI0025ABF67F|nr:putative transferase At4g12130, mitochondrial isoform X2 [Cryptomeria japonica]
MLPRRLVWASISPQQRLTEWLTGEAKLNSAIRSHFHSAATFRNCSEKSQSAAGSTSLSERGPFVSRLNSRGVLRFDGPDTVKFLQGLITNDLRLLEEQTRQPVPTPNQPAAQSGPVYAAFLNSQGRFLYDIFIYRPVRAEEKLNATGSGPGDDSHQPALLADVDRDSLHELLDHLNKYRLRAKVEIQDASKDMAAWQRFGGALVHESGVNKDAETEGIGWGGGNDLSGCAAAQGCIQSCKWFRDPRLASLGFRGIFPSDSLPPLVEADKEVDEQYYLLLRLEEGVPEGSAEIPKGEAIPLEYNLAGLNAISFEKGCYVGQELVARTHHRGVIRKRILPVHFTLDSGEDSGKAVGTVTTVLGSRGLALLRLEAALKNSNRLNLKGLENVRVEVIRPRWWPREWGQEEEQQAAMA